MEAATAGPPSPLKPLTPLPAKVEMLPEVSILRMRCTLAGVGKIVVAGGVDRGDS